MTNEFAAGLAVGSTITVFFCLYLMEKERESARRPELTIERNNWNRHARDQRKKGLRQEPPGPYVIQFRDGRTERAETWEAVEAILRAAYPDAVIGHVVDLADQGPHTLAWRNAIDDASYASVSLAVAMVTLAASRPRQFPPKTSKWKAILNRG